MNLSKKLLLAIGVFFLMSSCSIRQKSEQEVMSEIYSGTIPADYCKDQGLAISSLTDSQSFDENDWQWVSKNIPQLKRETWDNFVQVSSQQIPFPNDLDLGCRYTLQGLNQNLLGWSQENAVMTYSFSQIGFNSDKNQALVFSFFYFAGSGTEHIYFAEIVDGHWKVTNVTLMRIIN